MNRPNPDNYWDRGGFKLSDYNDDLEEYCNEIERINKNYYEREEENRRKLITLGNAINLSIKEIFRL